MAMTDYFKKNACQKITQTTVSNAHGNEVVFDKVDGAVFDGLLVKKSLANMTVGADRSVANNQYNLFVYATTSLAKDDKVCYTYRDGQVEYLRITTSAILNEELSGQVAWVTYEAETYVPTIGAN